MVAICSHPTANPYSPASWLPSAEFQALYHGGLDEADAAYTYRPYGVPIGHGVDYRATVVQY